MRAAHRNCFVSLIRREQAGNVEHVLDSVANLFASHTKPLVARVSRALMLARRAAGTGKTVVTMHRVAWLLRQPYIQETDKILFVTFKK